MKKSLAKIIGAVVLAATIALSSVSAAFGANTGETAGVANMRSGHRSSSESNILWAKNVNFTYKDAQNNEHTAKFNANSGFCLHYFSEGASTGDIYSPKNFAVCIEPDKAIDGFSSGDIIASDSARNDVEAYSKNLTKDQQILLNYVLANGYSARAKLISEKDVFVYYFATQLLVYETVTGIRSTVDFSVDDTVHEALTPNEYLTGEHVFDKAKTLAKDDVVVSKDDIQEAYDHMVDWVKQSLQEPTDTVFVSSFSDYATQTKTQIMEYNPSMQIYEYSYTDRTGIISKGHTEKVFDTKDSDVYIYTTGNDQVTWYWEDDNTIKFVSARPLTSPVFVGFLNSNTRALRQIVADSHSPALMLAVHESSDIQCLARGANIPLKASYFQLDTEKIIPSPLLGDINLDGKVDVVDATLVQYHASDVRTLKRYELQYADVNFDGEVNIVDATKIQRIAAQLA